MFRFTYNIFNFFSFRYKKVNYFKKLTATTYNLLVKPETERQLQSPMGWLLSVEPSYIATQQLPSLSLHVSFLASLSLPLLSVSCFYYHLHLKFSNTHALNIYV